MNADEKAATLLGAREHRGTPVSDFELRSQQGDELLFTGYAALFDTPYTVGSGPLGPFEETIDRRAFNRTLNTNPDVVLRTEHVNLPLARTPKTLRLAADTKGLHVDATLDRRDADVRNLEVKMERGDLREMSFVFRAIKDEWSSDYKERRLLEVSLDKGDVSIVTYGSNPDTSARMDRLGDVLQVVRSLDVEEALMEARSLGDDFDGLLEARDLLSRLIRDGRPRRTLTVAEALREIL
jgi:HK97 family phage prohead protease